MGRPKIYENEKEKLEAQRVYNKTHYYKRKEEIELVGEIRELSSCQEEARELLEAFIYDIQKKIFLLNGNAGTGKTHLICKIILQVLQQEFDKIYILTPTNKALDVLKQKIGFNNKENKQIVLKTLCQFYNSKERFNEKGKKLGFAPQGLRIYNYDEVNYYVPENLKDEDIILEKIIENPWFYVKHDRLEGNDIIIIDECSMITKFDYNLLMSKYGNYKIIFLGDKLQLPPIEDKKEKKIDVDATSIIFDKKYEEFNMTTILRTKKNDIGAIYELTRNIVKNQSKRNTNNVLQEIQNTNKAIHMSQFKYYLKKDLAKNLKVCILSFKNSSVNFYDEIVRKCLEETKTKICGYYTKVEYTMTNYYEGNLKNNINFEIVNVNDNLSINIDKDLTLNGLMITTNIDKGTMYILDQEEYEVFDEFVSKNFKIITNNKKTITKEEKLSKEKTIHYLYNQDAYIMTKYNKELEGAIAYLSKLRRIYMQRNFESFKLSLSTTIHRSQGSGYDKVYLNVNDIYSTHCITPLMKSKLLYVGATRAINDIIFF